MTTQEKLWITKLVDEIEEAVPLRAHEVPVLLGMLRRTLNGTHGAASHAGAKRGRRPKAVVSAEMEGAV